MHALEVTTERGGRYYPNRDTTVLNRSVVNRIGEVLGVDSVHPRRIEPNTATWRLELHNGSDLYLATYHSGRYARRSGILVPDYVRFTEGADTTASSQHEIRGLLGVEWGRNSVTFVSDGLRRGEDRIALEISRSGARRLRS